MPHINELYDFTVTAVIVNQGRVLLVHHLRYGMWLPIGGHIEPYEDPEEALHREIEEETGLKKIRVLSSRPDFRSPGTKALLTPNYVDVHEANLPHKHITFVYFVVSASADFVLSQEHNAMRWLTPDELLQPIYNLSKAVIFYAQAALTLAEKKLD